MTDRNQIRVREVEDGQQVTITHPPRESAPGISADSFYRRLNLEPYQLSAELEIRLVVSLNVNEPDQSANPTLGIGLDREEVIVLRDACESFLDPGATQREFEKLRAHLARMEQVDGK